jgi:hypothetical protein
MQFIKSVARSIESFVGHSDLWDWAMIATVLVVAGYLFLRKVDGT